VSTYTSKRGRKYHGFKIHIASDVNGMIKEVITTTAKESDIKQLDKLMENEKGFVFAKGLSKEKKKSLRKKGIFGGIIERRVRGQKKLRTKQKKNNKKFAKVRAIVELPFAFIKNLMNYTKTRFIGLEKNDQYHLLLATAYNLRRVPNLQKRMTM
jgi:IS5 family transposase